MLITLEDIKAEHAKVAEMIASFEAQTKVKTICFPELEIELSPGEHYAGIITGKDGELSYHVILLPEQVTDIKFEAAKEWAEAQGGELPTRREQSLLFANLKEQFEERSYWSSEEDASEPAYAWFQYFINGNQSLTRKLYELRARAVRRLIIQ